MNFTITSVVVVIQALLYSFSIAATKVSYPFEEKSQKDALDRCWI